MSSKNGSLGNRYLWVDNLKLLACLLVVWGHLYMSMMAGGWIEENNVLYCWPIQTVYTFHVPLFFVCSGFLYQATVKGKWNAKRHVKNIKKKALALGVPYLAFSSITLLLKNVFADEVNNQATPFLKTILIEPIAPYWYLYVLFLLFCLFPPATGVRKKKALIAITGFAVIIKVIYVMCLADAGLPDPVAKIMVCAIWFCMGMLITEFPFKKTKALSWIAGVGIVCASILSLLIYSTPNDDVKVQFLLASVFVVTITYFFQSREHYNANGIVSYSVKYFMPVYAMHTIVAAGVRTVLLKVGVSSGVIHFFIGLVVSISVPVVVYEIAEKHWWMLFWFEPLKALKLKKQAKVKESAL